MPEFEEETLSEDISNSYDSSEDEYISSNEEAAAVPTIQTSRSDGSISSHWDPPD